MIEFGNVKAMINSVTHAVGRTVIKAQRIAEPIGGVIEKSAL